MRKKTRNALSSLYVLFHATHFPIYVEKRYLEIFHLLTFPALFLIYLQGRCNRDKPPCKYFHPPQHLKDQLLINGRNHLALKNALMQQMGMATGQQVIPGQVPAVVSTYLEN